MVVLPSARTPDSAKASLGDGGGHRTSQCGDRELLSRSRVAERRSNRRATPPLPLALRRGDRAQGNRFQVASKHFSFLDVEGPRPPLQFQHLSLILARRDAVAGLEDSFFCA